MRFSLGITGHRATNKAYRENTAGIEESLTKLFTVIGAAGIDTAGIDAAGITDYKPRLHALLAMGADLLAVDVALAMDWQVTAPLPFGKSLNIAINAQAQSAEDARAMLTGSGECSPIVAANAAAIAKVAARVTCFELTERDDAITKLFLDSLEYPQRLEAIQAFTVAASERAALAGRVMIEQIDLLIAVWDGHSPGSVGGTRHTIGRALDIGISVLWIDAGAPNHWRLLDTPEALAGRWNQPLLAETISINRLLSKMMPHDATGTGEALLEKQRPPAHSRKRFHAYRRIEALFAGDSRAVFRSLTQYYPSEEQYVANDAALMLGSAKALLHNDPQLAERTESQIVRRFVRADATATYLSDAYRGGMVANLVLAAFAVIGGIAYLPIFDASFKWPFALFEFAVLGLILLIIAIGRKGEWHGRWFQTRRVAEYLRHAPFMLLLGVARPTSAWPRGADTSWPEDYVRGILREIGLPNAAIDRPLLRTALEQWIGVHVKAQRHYHIGKADRLNRIHNNLERISEKFFLIAILIVALYLGSEIMALFELIPAKMVHKASKLFTFLGVALPTLGGALAGIHYFADFGRFAAISASTASRLEAIEQRIVTLLAAPEDELDYGRVADLARAVDETVVSEIEHWQDVFGGKHISVPV